MATLDKVRSNPRIEALLDHLDSESNRISSRISARKLRETVLELYVVFLISFSIVLQVGALSRWEIFTSQFSSGISIMSLLFAIVLFYMRLRVPKLTTEHDLTKRKKMIDQRIEILQFANVSEISDIDEVVSKMFFEMQAELQGLQHSYLPIKHIDK